MNGYWYFFGINRKMTVTQAILQYQNQKNRRLCSKKSREGMSPSVNVLQKMAQKKKKKKTSTWK